MAYFPAKEHDLNLRPSVGKTAIEGLAVILPQPFEDRLSSWSQATSPAHGDQDDPDRSRVLASNSDTAFSRSTASGSCYSPLAAINRALTAPLLSSRSNSAP